MLGLKDRIFYGWIVVAAALGVVSTLVGIRFSFGVFFKALEAEFDMTRTATSSIYSVAMLLYVGFTIVIGWALDRYGPRWVVSLMGLFTGIGLLITSQATSLWQIYLSYSLLMAIGTSAAMPAMVAVVSRWFDRKRGFALGIATSGAGLGTLVVAPSAAYLISNLGWRMSFTVLGLIIGVVVVSLAMFLKRDPGEIGARPDGAVLVEGRAKIITGEGNSYSSGLSMPEVLRTRSFWLMWMVMLLFGVYINLIMTHVVPYATDVGITVIEASTILSVASGVHIAFRFLIGRASDTINRKIPGMVGAILGGGILIWLIGSHSLWMFYLFAVIFGLAWAGVGITLVTLPGDCFGRRSIGVIMGSLEAGFSVGSAIGATLGGLVFDATNSYTTAFIIGAIVMLIMSLLVVFTRCEIGRRTGQKLLVN